jgi:hypothetical protein
MTGEPLFDVDSLRALTVRLLKDRCEATEGRPAPARVDWLNLARALRRAPAASEARLVSLSDSLGLEDFELLGAALCLAADDDPHVARIVARAQDPIGGSRPLIGLLSALFRPLGATPLAIAAGKAMQTGLLTIADERGALPERSVGMPLAVAAAIGGHFAPPSGIETLHSLSVELTAAQHRRAQREADWLVAEPSSRLLAIRLTGDREAVALTARVGDATSRVPVLVEAKAIGAHAAWLVAAGALPCIRASLGPGERLSVGSMGHYRGPAILMTGPDGTIEAPCPVHEWAISIPDHAERRALWTASGFDEAASIRAAQSYRQGAGRIAELTERAGQDDGRRDWPALVEAVTSSPTQLDGLARRSTAHVARSDLVLPEAALGDLDLLVARIRERNSLADGLGPAIAARYRPGVRALFTGESGTGKTLAAHWLARETGLPLYRVDQAALTSKWIGETEKNLSTILNAAQNADVVLFFDEADALFGARTDVRDANDRHANAQTNYLLQRIEEHEGVIVLATNGRDRFDPAFVRRLDTILAFPMPDARARQALWQVHLGHAHTLSADEIGRLAVTIDLAGGHIRNIVLGAAVRARVADRAIGFADVAGGAQDEYAKLGRALPAIMP